jgi:hypothetical protein
LNIITKKHIIMSNLPQNIKLTIHGEEIEFSLTGKREIKYYGKTVTSNESLWRTDKLEDNEVFYRSEWGWGVFVKIEERELSLEERQNLYFKLNPEFRLVHENMNKQMDNFNIPTKLITLTYNNETIENYE